jgi:F-type H+-transporting ATPase subunit b
MNFWQLLVDIPTVTLVAAETATESGGLFDLDATLPIMAVQFLLLVVVLNQLFFQPLTGAIDQRNDYVRNQISEAKEKLEKTKALAIAYEKSLVDARKLAQDKIATAQAEANKLRTQQIAEAIAQAQAKSAEARTTIEQQKIEAKQALSAEVEALSGQILSKLLGDLVGVA